jgi:hypothetical protein
LWLLQRISTLNNSGFYSQIKFARSGSIESIYNTKKIIKIVEESSGLRRPETLVPYRKRFRAKKIGRYSEALSKKPNKNW